MPDTIFDVDLAKDVKDYVASNDDITFESASLKDAIMSAKDFDILRIGKRISSHVIVSVTKVDDAFLRDILES